jgi:chromate transporter
MRFIAAAAVLAVGLGCGEILLIFAAAALGLILAWRAGGRAPRPERPREEGGTASKMPGALLLLAPAVSSSVLGVFLSFLKMGFVVYGSGYVLLAYLRSELVENLHWITDRQLLDAVAVGQVTPGPVFTTATFLGYQIAGLPGALAATAGIFGPSFLMVGLLASVLNRHAGSPRLRVFLDCVNAASFALMLTVTVQLAYASLCPGGHVDWVAWAIGLVSLAVLLRTKLNSACLLAAGAALGLFFGRAG